jgi:predicted CoA-binding protein
MQISDDEKQMRRIFETVTNVAVVGLSRDPEADSREVAEYLRDAGFRIIPVNPNAAELMNEKCYPDLASIPDNIDLVDIFRPSEDVMPIVEQAIQKGAKVIWMQVGIVNEEAAQAARNAGLKVIQDRCIMVEHERLFAART